MLQDDQSPQLGRIQSISVRNVWSTEGRHFTPWLAKPENLALVSDVLQLGSLAVESVEHSVGEFYADIVARDEDNNLVVIENQFGSSDHDHLGKALTYLAGVTKAKKLIWIAERIREPHRAVIDWLNTNTPEEAAFFGLEVELLSIDGSSPAPRFNVVCKPNNWRRRASRQATSGEWTEDKRWYFAYWSKFAALLEERRTQHWIREIPTSQWWGGGMGRTGFNVYAMVRRTVGEIRVDLQIADDIANVALAQLMASRGEIEAQVGEVLTWTEPPRPGKRAYVSVGTNQFDPNDETQWPAQHLWLLERMEAFRTAFLDRIARLTLAKGQVDEEMEGDEAVSVLGS